MQNPIRLGGSFAPPLSSEQLAGYRELAKTAPDLRVRDAMLPLCDMLEKFWETPASPLAGSPNPLGNRYPALVPLEQKEVDRIWDLVPWDYECDAIGLLFDSIPNETQKPLRDAAHHLLWFARELTKDREPLTNDKIQG